MVVPPAGPPPSTLPEGWKAHWNPEYKAWFYENIYTEESVWEKPTEPVYPPQATARLPPGPPPGYQATQQPTLTEKIDGPTSLPNSMAAVSLTDGNPYSQPPQPASTYAAAAPQPSYNSIPPPNAASPQPAPPSLYSAAPQAARVPSPQPAAPGANPTETTRDYNSQAPKYPPQPTYPGYPPQQAPAPGYPPQPQYSPQPNYAQPYSQPQYSQAPPGPPQPAGAPAQKGLMGMLQGKVGKKVPGGANTLLGVGGGLLAGAVLEHEWDKHEERERRHHHGGFGGFGGLMRNFGGDSGGPVVENVTIDENVYVDNNDSFISF